MDDAHFIETVAREFFERYGHAAAAVLSEQAEISQDLASAEAAQSWRDIA